MQKVAIALVTALNPHIGYLNAATVVKESLKTGKSLPQIVIAKKLMGAEQLAKVLALEQMSTMRPSIEKRLS
ncbi:MAG: hypothetical protein KME05_16575 [Gloeocapsa sp. UFS-A4-WI-NPMV-4B04]|jgi:aspartate ammonia-lyase|nr:hypothetical protein [Gloeocapsa sp. UFS-A4-WI-NPMV-4B04]